MNTQCFSTSGVQLDLGLSETDSPEFIELVRALITGAVSIHCPEWFFLVKINNWFGFRWLGFCGKLLGALGHRMPGTGAVMPPFVQNRIVFQAAYRRDLLSGAYQSIVPVPALHHVGESGANITRTMGKVAHGSAGFWYSGNTARSGKGTFMAYIPVPDRYWMWFLSFEQNSNWRIAKHFSISDQEIQMFLDRGNLKPTQPPE